MVNWAWSEVRVVLRFRISKSAECRNPRLQRGGDCQGIVMGLHNYCREVVGVLESFLRIWARIWLGEAFRVSGSLVNSLDSKEKGVPVHRNASNRQLISIWRCFWLHAGPGCPRHCRGVKRLQRLTEVHPVRVVNSVHHWEHHQSRLPAEPVADHGHHRSHARAQNEIRE